MNSQKLNYKHTYLLLGELCEEIGGTKKSELHKIATHIVSNSRNFDVNISEKLAIAKITDYLATRKSHKEVAEFHSLLDEIGKETDDKFRAQLFTFLHSLASSRDGGPPKEITNLLANLKTDSSNNEISQPDMVFFKQFSSASPASSGFATTPSSAIIVPFKPTSSLASSDVSEDENANATKNLQDELMQEVIYACHGIEGRYLRKNVISGGFKVDPIKAKSLNISEINFLQRYGRVGFLHNKIVKCTDSTSGSSYKGLLGQGYMAALRDEITELYRLVAMLQDTLNKQIRFEVAAEDRLSLRKLMMWLNSPKERFEWLVQIADSCRDMKGGALASGIHKHLCNGDPAVNKMVQELLSTVCIPLQSMLKKWLLEGEIEDPHSEFFIEEITNVETASLWHDKYRIREMMLPSFISHHMAKKIVLIGKSINFLKEVCEVKTQVKDRDDLKNCLEKKSCDLFSSTADTILHNMINKVYVSTSKMLLDVVMGPHQLMEHLKAMKNYLLLGKGDFINVLMENMKDELDRPAKDIYEHDLFSIMAASVRSTTAETEDPEVLEHLDVRLMYPFHGDSGWDIFTLRYTCKGPLATILEPSMPAYQTLFKPLWKSKHVDFILTNIWKTQMLSNKHVKKLTISKADRDQDRYMTCSEVNITDITQHLHILTYGMIQFVRQMQYYILFEVIECSWEQLLRRVIQAKDLDDILDAHKDFLDGIRIGTFLEPNSKPILLALSKAFDSILDLEGWQNNFYHLCYEELEARQNFEKVIKESEKAGKYGVTSETALERAEELKKFDYRILKCNDELTKLRTTYEDNVRHLMVLLTSSSSINLQQFGIRLDFNEFYKKQNPTLQEPLRFEHLRMTMMVNSSSKRPSTIGYTFTN